MNKLTEIAEVLKSAQSIAIMGHMNPDGDSIGSTLAAGLALKKLGKKVNMLCVDKIPEVYEFLSGYNELQVLSEEIPQCDLLLMVDCTDTDRVGEKIKDFSEFTIVNIDHHVSNKMFGKYNYVQSEVSATGEIIYNLIQHLNIDISKEIAEAIYVAIVMDTGSFKYSNTSAATHKIISELISEGIKVDEISTCLFENKEITSIKVLSTALSTLHFSEDKKISWMSLDYQTLQALQAKDEHIDEVINYTRMIKGVEIGLLFRESEPGKIKISLRSKSYADVNKLAEIFGGGGHARAAGCRIYGNIQEKIGEVVTAAKLAVQRDNK